MKITLESDFDFRITLEIKPEIVKTNTGSFVIQHLLEFVTPYLQDNPLADATQNDPR